MFRAELFDDCSAAGGSIAEDVPADGLFEFMDDGVWKTLWVRGEGAR